MITEDNLFNSKYAAIEYPTVIIYFFRFGNVPNDFEMNYFHCSGSETGIENCPHSGYHNCGENEAAGVVCFVGSTCKIYKHIMKSKFYFYLWCAMCHC